MMAEQVKKSGRVWIGTSGWSYAHWAGRFYPDDIRKKDWFGYFAQQFDTVELNATFYHLFPETTYAGWEAKAPGNFLYAVKMWRWVTHRKKLRDVEEDTQTALERAALLGRRLGPILVQLPPSLKRNDERLREYMEVLKTARRRIGRRFAFTIEFRHPSWDDEAVYRILERENFALCLPDGPRVMYPRRVTSYFTYVRFHGRAGMPDALYPEAVLADWAAWLRAQRDAGVDVYVYFNNDYNASAITNARQMIRLMGD